MDRQLFIIGVDAWRACSTEEVEATVSVLKQVEAYALPFDAVDLDIPADEYINWTAKPGEPLPRGMRKGISADGREVWVSHLGPSCIVRLEGVNLVGAPIRMLIIDHRTGFREDIGATAGVLPQRCVDMANLLITLLATRNATKTVRHSKLAKLGIGKKKDRYEYTTTISTPKVDEMADDEEHPPTGRTVCPHLRRAHVKNVVFGPGRTFRRAQLIQAVFVNADKEWTKTRIGYNVSLGGGPR